MYDKFIINLPDVPGPKEIWAEALAAYYQAFPTLFGVKKSLDYSEPGNVQNWENIRLGEINGKSASSVDDHPRGVGSIGVSGHEPNDFIDFSGTVLQILARIWRGPQYVRECQMDDMILGSDEHGDGRKLLLDDERRLLITRGDMDKKTGMLTKIREIWPGFLNIWNFKIQFNIVKGYKFENGKWNDLPKNVIQLNYPHKPEIIEDSPTALASYNASGRAFPLTCY